MAPPFVAQDLLPHDRRTILLTNFQHIGHQSFLTGDCHPILELNQNAVRLGIAAPTEHFGKAPALIQRLPDIAFEAIVQEAKYVKQRGLTRAVRAHDDHKGWNILEVHVAESLEIFQSNRFDSHRVLL